MTRSLAPLLAFFLLAASLRAPAAEDPPFTVEAVATVSYAASDTDRVEVVVAGVPVPGFSLEGAASGPGVELGGTWYACGVADDGASPRALLPLLSRSSFAGLSAGLTAERRDSEGTSTGQLVRITSTLTGDGNATDLSGGGGWYVGRATAILAGIGWGRERWTEASRLDESPSGKTDLGRIARRSSALTAGAGLLRWLGEDLLVTAGGEWTGTDARRSDEIVLSPSGTTYEQQYENDVDGWGVSAGARALLLGRRLVVDLSGRYGEAREDVTVTLPEERPFGQSKTIERDAALAVTWYPARDLGVGLSAGYGTESLASGVGSLRPMGSVTRVPVGLSASWFPVPRASLSLAVAETFTRGTYPPDSPTYEKYEGRATRVSLSGALRF